MDQPETLHAAVAEANGVFSLTDCKKASLPFKTLDSYQLYSLGKS